ncbi:MULTISPECIES: hypothetical protein [Bradyrhizobium]|jgi:hypothetical protein|nr:hypothetical protein [Bradyrhizobium diazoefficiens]MBP1062230.1 hypothetical protein [Bradyrhizobium japonicum]AND92351.1 hypothetical protein AAV28_34615 [Bradyrhizobium diazoefficiens USDA 110]AWO94195.2 hypothetical protein DI395_40720 [Bradyrhizobium diazoefficiens]QLD41016.1 hypothetical protein HUW42_08495 [Bradyrhizobium diazoefficiens]WLA75430.1 hypothetical protein QIH77_09680 [Bradyrhizobium diazoefficiens]
MPAFHFRKSALAAASGLALAVLVHPGAGFAYTQEEQQACTPDAMRLCGEFVPNVDAITACMIQKKAQLSPQCKVFFRQGPEPGEARAGRPTNIAPKSASNSAKKSTKPAPKVARKKKSEEG